MMGNVVFMTTCADKKCALKDYSTHEALLVGINATKQTTVNRMSLNYTKLLPITFGVFMPFIFSNRS